MIAMTEKPWFRAMSAAIGILVGIVQVALFMYVAAMNTESAGHERRLDVLDEFRVATGASRYTAQDANAMNLLLLQEIRNVESGLKECINRVILDGNRARC